MACEAGAWTMTCADEISSAAGPPLYSVVVPAYNEEAGIAEFHRRLAGVMNDIGAWEVVYVNDGSRDRTGTSCVEGF